MVRIRRFNIVKTATVVALIYVVIVAIFAIPFVLLIGIAGVSTNGGPQVGAGAVGLLVAAVVIALFYGVVGWIVTAIGCAVYNLVAGWVGGIEVEVERVEPPAPPPPCGRLLVPARRLRLRSHPLGSHPRRKRRISAIPPPEPPPRRPRRRRDHVDRCVKVPPHSRDR